MVDRICNKVVELGKDIILDTHPGSYILHKTELEGKRLRVWRCYKCPWCNTDQHYAMMEITEPVDWPVRPLHCPWTNNMGWVYTSVGNMIRDTLRREEEAVRNLYQKHSHLFSTKVTAQEAFILRTQDGCPEDIIEEICNDFVAYQQLFDQHIQKSKSSSNFKAIYEQETLSPFQLAAKQLVEQIITSNNKNVNGTD